MLLFDHHDTMTMSDGCRLYYEYSDRLPQRNCLIFLHGLGGDLSVWNEERKALSQKGIGSIAVDLRGHGLSDRPKKEIEYQLKRFCLDIYELIKAHHLVKPVLIGHCFGGVIALAFASAHAHLLHKLILIDATFKPPLFSSYVHTDSVLYEWVLTIAEHIPALHLGGHRNFQAYQGTDDWNWQRLLSDIAYTSLHSYLLSANQIQHLEAFHQLDKVTIPTLIIEGEDDLITPIPVAQTMHKQIKNSILHLIPGGNHITVINNPQDVTSAIFNFVARTPRG